MWQLALRAGRDRWITPWEVEGKARGELSGYYLGILRVCPIRMRVPVIPLAL